MFERCADGGYIFIRIFHALMFFCMKCGYAEDIFYREQMNEGLRNRRSI